MKLHKPLLLLVLLFGAGTVSYAQTPAPGVREGATVDLKVEDDTGNIIKNLGRQLALNVVFDESVKVRSKVRMELKDVTVAAALQIVFVQKDLRACWTEDNTILVYADTPELRERFAQYKLWEPKSKESK